MITQEADKQKNTVPNESKRDKRDFLTNKGKGRPKGVKNKQTRNAQEIINHTFEGLGGSKALITWAQQNEKNKAAFYTLIWPKVIPKNIDIKADITHDIASRLLEARSRSKQLESNPKLIEIDNQGKIVEEVISQSVVEEIKEEENE